MNWRIAGILVGLFILLNAGIYFLINGGNKTTSYNPPAVSTPQIPQTTQSTNSINLPLATKKGVDLSFLIYNISGKITKEDTTSVGTKITLDSPGLPDLIATKDTKYFRQENNNNNPITLADLTLGTNVNITLSYNVKAKAWALREIYVVAGNPDQTPTPAPK